VKENIMASMHRFAIIDPEKAAMMIDSAMRSNSSKEAAALCLGTSVADIDRAESVIEDFRAEVKRLRGLQVGSE
jgi:hypothetical protein